MPTSSAGYSGTPLVKKLGLQVGLTVQVIDAPMPYDEVVDGLSARSPHCATSCRSTPPGRA